MFSDTIEMQMNARQNVALREEYGEADRPMPSTVIHDMREKFTDWDMFKVKVIKNNIDQKKRMRYMRVQ